MNMNHTGRDQRAFNDKLKSARMGVAEAQYELGLMYANGVGVEQDIEKAVHWVAQAAQRGMVQAQYLLATRYELGIGVAHDVHAAWGWYHKAADQGSAKAMLRMGKLYAQAHPQASALLYEKAAAEGNPEAQLALAACFESGAGLEKNPALAFDWSLKAAQGGLAAAQFAVAKMYLHGGPVDEDIPRAVAWLRKAARQDYLAALLELERLESSGEASILLRGNSRKRGAAQERRRQREHWAQIAEAGSPADQYMLGTMLEQGLGSEADSAAAMEWYERAARRGHAPAQAALGRLLLDSQPRAARDWLEEATEAGNADAALTVAQLLATSAEALESDVRDEVGSDLLKAMEHYLSAHRAGLSEAQAGLGALLMNRHVAMARAAYRAAADAGNAEAQYQLGLLLDAESPGMAFIFYEKAALQGHAQAQAAVGVAYMKGRGLKADARQAVHWLQKAAEQGHAAAQWNISVLYVGGRPPLKRDLKQAYVWCQRSADQGFLAAISHMGLLNALMGNGALAAVWWQKAAKAGDAEAQYNLGVHLINGDGVEQDAVQGFEWLYHAAEQGLAPAQSRVGLLYSSGEVVPLDPIEGYKWLLVASEGGDEAARANLQRAEALFGMGQLREARRRVAEWKRQKQKK